MADRDELDQLWLEDIDWVIGQMVIVGWDGTEVTPHIRSLIQDHHVGAVLLTAKNMKSAADTASLVQQLQALARQSGHPCPLLVAIDQENGGVNSLFDEDLVCQFPSAMGVAATGRVALAYEIGRATATEIAACGVNLMLGPVLDVLSNAKCQPLGVRAASDDPHEVSAYGAAAMDGIHAAGVACSGKHFPSYGNLDFLGSTLDVPIITQTLEEMGLGQLVPFRAAVASGRLDAVMVGGCAIASASMKVAHACLSSLVVDDLLRGELAFGGVAISDCLEMEALSDDMGVQNGVLMAVEAGCDLVMTCRSYPTQIEALRALRLGFENGALSRVRLLASLRRLLRLKTTYTSWTSALNPPGVSLLAHVRPSHVTLSEMAYDESIAVVRDHERLLPLSKSMQPGEELLLLTPLLNPLPASSMTKALMQTSSSSSPLSPLPHHRGRTAVMSGEGVFRELGRALARARHGRLLHTSYTASGVRPMHEGLIDRASTVIIVTADANRNLYQAGFAKHVYTLCSMMRARTGRKKSVVVVAVSSPYDFALDNSVGTYVCTFDFTDRAMSALVRALFGSSTPSGSLPGTLRPRKRPANSRRLWLVEPYEPERDSAALTTLLRSVARGSGLELPLVESATPAVFVMGLPGVAEAHFVVRNSSTGELYGFVATYVFGETAVVGALMVEPSKRNASIGRSLHQRALRTLLRQPGVKKVRLGTALPAVFAGIPVPINHVRPVAVSDDDANRTRTRDWFSAMCGWDTQFPRRIAALALRDLQHWTAPDGLLQPIQRAGFAFDLVHGPSDAVDNNGDDDVIRHVAAHGPGPDVRELYALALREGAGEKCGIVRAKDVAGAVLGSVLVSGPDSPLSRFVPGLGTGENGTMVSGMLAPVVVGGLPSTTTRLLLQGLALVGLRQNRKYEVSSTVVRWVSVDDLEPLLVMGFEVVQVFEEVTNTVENAFTHVRGSRFLMV